MIGYLSVAFVRWLQNNRAVSENEAALYAYAVHSILFSGVPVFLVLGLGLALGMVLESLIFIFPFILLRQFCGGFHVRSRVLCLGISIFLLAVFLFFIRFLLLHKSISVVGILTLISGVIIFVLSPVDSKKRALTEKELVFFRRAARSIESVILLVFALAAVFSLPRVFVPLGMGICLTALLQIPCLFEKD